MVKIQLGHFRVKKEKNTSPNQSGQIDFGLE